MKAAPFARSGLMLYLLPLLGRASDADKDPFEACWGSGVMTESQFPDGTTDSFWTWEVDDVRPCLENIKIDLNTMAQTLENLFFGVSTTYAFTTIVTDTAASVQRNRCGLDVHELKVDLYQELALIWQELVEPAAREAGLRETSNRTAEQILDVLFRPTRVAALDFHCRLNALFTRLQDAHTRYTLDLLTPVVQILPLRFNLVAAEPGELQVVKVLAKPVISDGSSDDDLREVVEINGQPPLAFLQPIADRRGLYLDEGQRLNALLLGGDLLGNPQGEQGLSLTVGSESDVVSPGAAAVHVAFADGGELEVKWKLQLHPNTTVALLTGQLNFLSVDISVLQQMDLDRLALRRRQLEQCKRIPGCSPKVAEHLVPHAHIDPHALRAYRRLFGSWLPEDMLDQLIELSAARDLARITEAALPVTGGVASPYLRLREQHSVGETPGEVDIPNAGAPHLRGAHRTPSADSVAAASGGPRTENMPNSSSPVQDTEAIQVCLANYSHLVGSGAVEVLYAPTEPGLGTWMTVLGLGDMVVIKMVQIGAGQDGLGTAMEGYKIAVEYARQHGIRRLLLDLIGNGGGLVSLSDLLQSLLLKVYDARELCLDYDKKVNEYWRQWIISYGAGIDDAVEGLLGHLTQKARNVPLRVGKWLARWHLRHLRIIVNASNRVLGFADACGTFNLTKINRWIQQVGRARSMGDLLGFMGRVLRRHEFVPGCLYRDGEGRDHDRSGWYPFLGDEILERNTLRPFPNLTGLLEPIRQMWGDARRADQRYSRRGPLSECPGSMASLANLQHLAEQGNPDLREFRDHPFTDVALLTDGLAGSSGSELHTALMASGYMTAFTYGGTGKVMDSSAFSGGNVLEYGNWWKGVAVAAEMGMWLVPGSSWERLSRKLDLTSDFSDAGSIIYPRPMPLHWASASFTFNMMYVPKFAVEGDETMLPRQFYRLPAHKHYNVWPSKLLFPCDNPAGLLEMYARVQQEDWWWVRRNPQHLNDGWSSACVPDDMHMECCEARQGREEQQRNLSDIAGEL